MRKILRKLRGMQPFGYNNTTLNNIKPKILHEFFFVNFRFLFKDGKVITIAVKDVVMAFFNDFENLLASLSKKTRGVIIGEILGSIISINESYVKYSNKKIRKYTFIKTLVIEKRIDLSLIIGVEDQREGIHKELVWGEPFIRKVDNLKINFERKFKEAEDEREMNQDKRIDSFSEFDMLIKETNTFLQANCKDPEVIQKTEDITSEIRETLFFKTFEENLSKRKERNEELNNRKNKLTNKLNQEFFFKIGLKNDFETEKIIKGMVGKITEVGKQKSSKEEGVIKGLHIGRNQLARSFKAGFDAMSLFSCEKFNQTYGEKYNKKLFLNPFVHYDQ